ncbi:hypothetical protein D779_2576 [Imhoffiella purpurea]|uniref:Uncharacterized protein n=1 Tax=Imhoffiella purpurea TaxID=1249627 RepID=W9VVJ8_9GAMM|nr:hypothetical protein D779_2576 [Imhoffiella purpurea]
MRLSDGVQIGWSVGLGMRVSSVDGLFWVLARGADANLIPGVRKSDARPAVIDRFSDAASTVAIQGRDRLQVRPVLPARREAGVELLLA